MKYIVCYDITDGKRLRRIASLLKHYGMRVEKSVFECHLEEPDYEKLLASIRSIASGKDAVHVYCIPVNLKCTEIRQKKDKIPNEDGEIKLFCDKT